MVTRKELLEDLQGLGKLVRPVTRNYYRANGKFTETDWHNHFSRFTDFLNAAGLSSQQQLQEKSAPEVSDIKGDIWDITLPKTNIHTLDQLLDYCKVDLSIWKVERFIVNKWEMGYKNEDDKASSLPLFQVKATLVRKADVVAVKKEIEELMALAKQSARKPSVIVHKSDGELSLEINISDVHFGKLGCFQETGYSNYDTKIAQKTFIKAFDTLLDRVKNYKFKEILFVVGNDLLNSDNEENTTTKGTIVTTDGRYHKTFSLVRNTMINCIERLRSVAPLVKVMMVKGNHDALSVWHLGDSLECYFHNYDDVKIDNGPTYRKYYSFGKVLLMFTHGDKAKLVDLPMLMATEQPILFGSTKYREIHTGHTHKTKLDEKFGVRVRTISALTGTDDWHSENGYVGNLRNAEAFIWDAKEGLISQVFYNADADEELCEINLK